MIIIRGRDLNDLLQKINSQIGSLDNVIFDYENFIAYIGEDNDSIGNN